MIAAWAVVCGNLYTNFERLVSVRRQIDLEDITGGEHAQFLEYPKQASIAIDVCLKRNRRDR